jgi:hypothetical protein
MQEQASAMPGWWQSWMTPAVVLALIAWLWIALRPALVRLLYHLLCLEPKKFEDTILSTLESKSGRVRFRAYSLDVHAERVQAVDKRIDEALEVANANKDSLTAIRQIQDLHGSALSDVQKAVRDVPTLTESITRLSKSMETFAIEMKAVNETMFRLDERSAMDLERRKRDVPNSPARRKTDK